MPGRQIHDHNWLLRRQLLERHLRPCRFPVERELCGLRSGPDGRRPRRVYAVRRLQCRYLRADARAVRGDLRSGHVLAARVGGQRELYDMCAGHGRRRRKRGDSVCDLPERQLHDWATVVRRVSKQHVLVVGVYTMHKLPGWPNIRATVHQTATV